MKTPLTSILLAALVAGALNTAASAQTATSDARLQTIVLDSGVTLADWIRVTRSREPSPSLATGAQAAQFVRRHGAYRELLDIVWRAAQHKDLQRDSVGRENAAERLAAVNEARRALGDWPTLLMASAAAKAYLGDAGGANEDLRRWMTLAAPTDASRERVTEVLLSVAQKPDAVIAWLTQSGVAAMPVALRRPVDAHFDKFAKDIARARECLGLVTQHDDLTVMREGRWAHNNEAAAMRVEHRITRIGLPTAAVTVLGNPSSIDYEYDETISAPTGGTWSRKKWSSERFTYDVQTWSRNIECSAPLLPAAKGKQVQFSWDHESSTEIRTADGTETIVSISRNRFALEFLSDAMSPEQLMALQPGLRMQLPADYRGRFYRAKWRSSFEDISPPRPGSQRLQSGQGEGEGLFVEGPNVYVGFSGTGTEIYKPGSTWTLTRPDPK